MAKRRQVRALAVAVVLAAGAVSAAETGRAVHVTGDPALRVQIRSRTTAEPVRAAIRGASLRLERPECGRIVSDFTDASGRNLQENLEALGQTPAGYLGLIVFVDGLGQARCVGEQVLALTTPGSRVIHICPQFGGQQRRDPALAETVIIHEALHSLGLGENPPSSLEITRRVRDRCGA
jgi:hypothetical protein